MSWGNRLPGIDYNTSKLLEHIVSIVNCYECQLVCRQRSPGKYTKEYLVGALDTLNALAVITNERHIQLIDKLNERSC